MPVGLQKMTIDEVPADARNILDKSDWMGAVQNRRMVKTYRESNVQQ